MLKFVSFLFSCVFVLALSASEGLIIHASEIGVGKFHRLDNKYHSYDQSAWKVFVLPDEASTQTPLIKKNSDGSWTIFFSTLEELLKSVVQLAESSKTQVDLLTIHGHGVPGGMWFPKDNGLKKSMECYSWNDMANAPDQKSYDLYYSGLQKSSALYMRKISENTMSPSFQCISGLRAWKDILARLPQFKKALASESQIHFLACVVGLGVTGDNFLTSLASELYSDKTGSIQASVKFGLGDWSIPEGMSFWDYLTDAQQEQDAAQYPLERQDRLVMQRGHIKVAQVLLPGQVQLGLIQDADFMLLEKDERPLEFPFIPF